MQRRRLLTIVALVALAAGLAAWLLRRAASGADGEDVTSVHEAATANAQPAGWDTLKSAQLPAARGTLSIRGTVVGPLGPISGARVVATEAEGEDVLSARMCQCDDHCGNKLLECNCAEAARQLHELVAARLGEAQPLARAVADAEGNFLLDGLAEGRFALWATSDEMAGVKADVAAGTSGVQVGVAPGVKLEGKVVDEAGHPVAGAWVTGIFTESSRFFDATSDAAGHFALSGLPRGAFRFVAAHEGLLPASTSLESAGAKKLELKMDFPRSLSGKVTAEGRPAAAARVELIGEHRKASAVADGQGNYSIGGLRSGDYVVRASGAQGVARAALSLDERDSKLNLQLGPAARVRGHVSDEAGAPVVAEVIASADETDVARVTSAADGAFELGELPPGKVSFAARLERRSGPDVVKVLLAGADETVELTVFRGATIVGRVVDSNEVAVMGAEVSFDTSDAGRSRPRPAKSDADGGFSVGGVEPGRRNWSVKHPDFVTATDEVEVPSASMTVHLDRGASIHGELDDEDGRPIASDVAARKQGDGADKDRFAKSDVQGQFELNGLRPGHYQVWGWGPDREISVHAETEVTEHASVRVNLKLEAGVAISGVVVDEAGAIAPGVTVAAYSASGRSIDIDEYERREAVSSADGGFSLTHLKADHSYRVVVGEERRFYSGKKDRVFKAPAADVRLVVPAKPHLHGRVVRSDGSPILDFTVAGEEKHTQDGRFDIVEDAEGEQTIEFSAKGFAPLAKKVSVRKGGVDLGDVTLNSGRTVTVTVLGSGDVPIAGATLRRSSDNEYMPPPMFDYLGERRGSRSLTTDAEGKARWVNAPNDEFSVRVTHPNWVTATASIPSSTNEATVQMTGAGVISGVVRGVDGGPLRACMVEATRDAGERPMMGFTREAGQFKIEAVPPGSWALVARDEEARRSEPLSVEVQAGGALDVELHIRSGGAVTAFRIQPAPDPEAMVLLTTVELGPSPTIEDFGKAGEAATWLRPQGDLYVGEGVSPGQYTVMIAVEREVGADGAYDFFTSRVTVPAKPGATVNVTLGAPRRLEATNH